MKPVKRTRVSNDKKKRKLNPNAPTSGQVEHSAYARAARAAGNNDPFNMPDEKSVRDAVERGKSYRAPKSMPSIQPPSKVKRKR